MCQYILGLNLMWGLDSKVTMEGKNLAHQELPPEDLLNYSQSILGSFLGMKDYIFWVVHHPFIHLTTLYILQT